MSALFLSVLNLAINASWLILAVVVVRLLLKKAPKWISCLLWGLVAVRLLCPVSLESALSLLPSGKVVPGNIEMVQDPHIDSGVRIIDNAVNPVIERSFSPDVASSANPMQVVVFVAGVIWLTGVALMLSYALISFILLKRKVRVSVALKNRIRECDEVDSPFILGIFRPMIYVPSGINDKTLEFVTAHEEAHLKRHDHWWKPLGFALLSVYWFNPLCWVAYILLCRDIEAACDEKVIRDRDREYMAAYSQALLDCSVNRRIIAACPLAFGETGVKERVKGVLNYKKPAFWVIIIAVIACIVVAVCFMTNPKSRYYDITVRIPAGSEIDTVWYSDEEVSPKGNTLKLDTGDFYRGVLILQAVEGNTDVVEQTAQLQSDTPVTFQVQPGVWYRVGLRINLKTGDNDITLKVRVRNSEVRIDSEDNRAELATMEQEAQARAEQQEAEKREAAEKERERLQDGLLENLGIEYEYIDGSYVVDGDMVYAYKKELSGRTPNAAYDTKYIVLTNNETITFEQVDRSFYSSNSADFLRDTIVIGMHLIDDRGNIVKMTDVPALDRGEADNPIGLQMYVKDVTPVGCTLVFSQNGGNVTGELQTGQWYEIQVRNAKGEWIDNSSKDVEIAWEDIAYLISNNGMTEMDLNWEYLYGRLNDGHYRIVKKVMDYRAPGDYDEYDIYAEFDIGDVAASTESVTDWMDITLPDGYSISNYDEAIGYMGGSLILPRSYHAEDSEYGPLEWQYSGLISRLPVDSGMATVTFDNGIPDPASVPHDNHTESEYVKTIGLERSNTQWSAIMLKENHDLYTASQVAEMENKGVDLTGKDLTSDYWTFWFVKEGEDTYYLLTLSAKEFTQKEAEDIAGTVSIE